MKYKIDKMTQTEALEIAYNWHYSGIYSFYDMTSDLEDLEEFLDTTKRRDNYFAVKKDNELIGFYSFTKTAENTIDLGLGMKPELTGNGWGKEFIENAILFIKDNYSPKRITLSVALFNQRAIKVYKRLEFIEIEQYMQETNGEIYPFIRMEYKC